VNSQLLDELSHDARRRLLQRCNRVRFGSGAYIFHAGEAGDSLHIIESGRVAVLAGGALGEPVTLMILSAGDVFGELALLSVEHRRTATIQAMTTTETFVLHRADFEDVRRTHPSVDRFLIRLLAEDVRRLTEQVVEAAELPAPTRIYRRIVRLGTLFEVAGSNTPIPVSQTQLASMAGAKLRVTNAVLAKAKGDGVLDLARRRIAVLDWNEVHRRARLRLT
jgi:CRP/FNR family transcriptional regulator, cyclic AMP receptor protein